MGLKATVKAIFIGLWIRILYKIGLEINVIDWEKRKSLELTQSIFKIVILNMIQKVTGMLTQCLLIKNKMNIIVKHIGVALTHIFLVLV